MLIQSQLQLKAFINHDERFQFGFNVSYQRRSKHLNMDSTESVSFYECTPTKANQGPVF